MSEEEPVEDLKDASEYPVIREEMITLPNTVLAKLLLDFRSLGARGAHVFQDTFKEKLLQEYGLEFDFGRTLDGVNCLDFIPYQVQQVPGILEQQQEAVRDILRAQAKGLEELLLVEQNEERKEGMREWILGVEKLGILHKEITIEIP